MQRKAQEETRRQLERQAAEDRRGREEALKRLEEEQRMMQQIRQVQAAQMRIREEEEAATARATRAAHQRNAPTPTPALAPAPARAPAPSVRTGNDFAVQLEHALTQEGTDLIEFPSWFLREITHSYANEMQIGQGSFGKVYTNTQRTVAVKVLTKEMENASIMIRRSFAAEVRVLRRLNHPHIVKLVGFCDEKGDLCLVYELAGKGSVDSILRCDQKAEEFTWKMRVRVLCGIAKALNYLHKHSSHPVYHRDIKSANIVLTELYTGKLIDCGLSKFIDSEEKLTGVRNTIYQPSVAGAVFGTPGYMCSRYLTTMQYDEKAEIYSFGISMLEILTGKIQLDKDDNLVETLIYSDSLNEHFDPRAGTWPRQVIDQLTQLTYECTYDARDYKKRLNKMDQVLKRLLAIEQEFCAETKEEEVLRQQFQQLQYALEALRVMQLTADQNPKPSVTHTCIVCFSDYDHKEGITCENEHFVCNSCFEGHLNSQLDTPLDTSIVTTSRQQNGQIYCPQDNPHYQPRCLSSRPFRDPEIARHVNDEVYMRYLERRKKIWETAVHRHRDELEEQILRTTNSTTSNRSSAVQLRRNRERDMYLREIPNARMCGRCSFGPIGHIHCYNLSTHHGEFVNGVAINNACHNCGWFAEDINQWPLWDAVLWEERLEIRK